MVVLLLVSLETTKMEHSKTTPPNVCVCVSVLLAQSETTF